MNNQQQVKKNIFVNRGETFKITTLENSSDGRGFFVVTDSKGSAIICENIDLGSVVLTTEKDKRVFALHSFEYELFLCIKNKFEESILANQVAISSRDIASAFNEGGYELHISHRTILKVSKSLGFETIRRSDGWAVVVTSEKINEVEKKFAQNQ